MKYIGFHLPIILSAVLSAFFSLALLGQTHIFSHFLGADYTGAAADGAFFLLTAIYALLIWRLGQRFPSPLFAAALWIITALLALPLLWL